MFIPQNSPLFRLNDTFFEQNELEFWVKRDDLIHSVVSGNKWRKLNLHLEDALSNNKTTIITFGGAFSNHIYATSYVCNAYGFKSFGFIRGDAHETLNSTLDFAQKHGMEIFYVSRDEYRDKNLLYSKTKNIFPNAYLIPEGGSSVLGILGCKAITEEILIDFDYIGLACGTGTTLAGISQGLKPEQKALGFSVLKGSFIKSEIENNMKKYNLENKNNFTIFDDYHFGGYAKSTPELIKFCESFFEKFNFEIEPIYTGKMFFGLFDQIKKGYFAKGSKIIALHTGGLRKKLE